MQNYLLDVLPDDIKTHIYKIRLATQVGTAYDGMITQRNIFIDYINNYNKYNHVLFYQHINTNVFSKNKENYTNVAYLDPSTKTLKILTKKLSKLMSYNFYCNLSKDDKMSLLINFIRPLERGLIIYKKDFDTHNSEKTYYETESYYLDIMIKLQLKIAPDILA